jgi:prepilin-type N-terminal cleavage/methylation domain-containing protein
MMTLKKGFTLIELLVSISIVTVIMAVVIFNYGGFNDTLALSAAEQDLAIAVREAQTYGLSVKEVSVGSGQFNAAYGIYFSPTSPSEYDVFVDKNGNGLYDAGSGCGSGATECLEKFIFRDGVTISAICDDTSCPPASASSMQVTFLRPNPDATINFVNSGGTIVETGLTGKAVLMSPQGKTATVTIGSTGQISVQ